MKRFLNHLMAAVTSRPSRRPVTRQAKPFLEALEERRLTTVKVGPPVYLPPPGVSMDPKGVIDIIGDSRDDVAVVSSTAGGDVKVTLDQTKYFSSGDINTPPAKMTTHTKVVFDAAQVTGIYFHGYGGNDEFDNLTALPCTALGDAGSDVLMGGSGDDYLGGGSGDDYLEGGAGNDLLSGGAGDDTFAFTGLKLGTDTIFEAGNKDSDTLDLSAFGGAVNVALAVTSKQTVNPGNLALKLSSSTGIENVIGSPYADTIIGNSRNNEIHGGAGNDYLDGAQGDDTLYGDDGKDELHGGAGNDVLHGGAGNDKLYGGVGNDTLYGNDGNDTLDGGTGDDVIHGGAASDTITDAAGKNFLYGDDGSDAITGGAGVDVIHGGKGNDVITGGSSNDLLYGDQGDDKLDGGPGQDFMDGGTGYDALMADCGNETLTNGEHVEIQVPTDSPQNDGSSCGPNSGSRLLRSYGLNVSYDQLKQDAQATSIISQFGLGTPPPTLQTILKKYKADTYLQSGAQFQTVLNLLGAGRPVIALIGGGAVKVPSPLPYNPFNMDTVPTFLHYVVLTGFDMNQQKLFFTDTDGGQKSFTFSEFQAAWNWPGDGLAYDGLAALGIQKQTILW